MKNKLIFLLTFSLGLLFIPSWPTAVDAQIYKYIDKRGTVHFTDRWESIPKEYRNQIETIKESPSPEVSAQPSEKEERKEGGETPPGKEKEQISPEKMAEVKRKEAEAKAAQEKEAREKKLRAQEEKIKRIEELNKQITAKQEEINKLRTTWMVYDRINYNRLSQEIEALQKEAQSIQEALTEERK